MVLWYGLLFGPAWSSGAFVDILVSGTLSNPRTSFVGLSQAHAVYWHELSARAMAGHGSGYWKIAPDSLLAELRLHVFIEREDYRRT